MARTHSTTIAIVITFALAIAGSSEGAGSIALVLAPTSAATFPADITIAWDPPDVGVPTSYIIEAGSASGLSDIAVFDTGVSTTNVFVAGVPDGVYFVRVKARNAGGISAPSDEIVVRVGELSAAAALSCSIPPSPKGMTSSVNGSRLTVGWTASPGATSYQVEAGTAFGGSDVFKGDVGNLSEVTAAVPPGRYFVRVRAKGGCGTSLPSEELVVTVGLPQ